MKKESDPGKARHLFVTRFNWSLLKELLLQDARLLEESGNPRVRLLREAYGLVDYENLFLAFGVHLRPEVKNELRKILKKPTSVHAANGRLEAMARLLREWPCFFMVRRCLELTGW
jgi:hypothetical protein